MSHELVSVKLELLGEALKNSQMTGWIIPKSDRHLGEYNPANELRLQYMTAFTGSAGLAIYLRSKAVLFVDGRYTIQAAQEVDQEHIEIRPYSLREVSDWLETHLTSEDILAYDPWLMSPNQLTTYRMIAKTVGARLLPATNNPIDSIWVDRPPPPVSKVHYHSEEFSGANYKSKLKTIFRLMNNCGCQYLPVTLADSVNWLLGIRGSDVPFNPFCLSYLLVDAAKEKLTWFVDEKKLSSDLRERFTDVDMKSYDDFEAQIQAIKEGKVWLDETNTPSRLFDILNGNNVEILVKSEPIVHLKAIKNSVEISGSRSVHRRDGISLVEFYSQVFAAREQVQEFNEVSLGQLLFAKRSVQANFKGRSFADISGYGANGAVVHYRANPDTALSIGQDSLYLLDTGGQYLEGTTDVTRTVCFGTPSPLMQRHYTLVLKGHLALGRAVFPEGTTGHQLDALARQFLWQQGLDYNHGTGHGVGSYLAVHEGPQSISQKPINEPLRKGMIVSNEPGLYLADQYGIRIENLMLVVDAPQEGFLTFEMLTLCPYAKNLIATELLDSSELCQIRNYYERIVQSLEPQLSERAVSWLASEQL